MSSRFRNIHVELLHHVPFTVFSVAAGMLVLGLLSYGAGLRPRQLTSATAPADHGAEAVQAERPADPHAANHPSPNNPARGLFHLFHPIHLLLSATATTAMFWRFQRRWLKAALVGTVGSVGVCGLSDVILPFVSGLVLRQDMDLHICLVEHAMRVVPFAAVGVLVGFLLPTESRRSTVFSHSSHVFVSAMASLLYLIAFGMTHWMDQAGLVLIFMVLAVVIPCCFSDIVFPLIAAGPGGGQGQPAGCGHEPAHQHGPGCIH